MRDIFAYCIISRYRLMSGLTTVHTISSSALPGICSAGFVRSRLLRLGDSSAPSSDGARYRYPTCPWVTPDNHAKNHKQPYIQPCITTCKTEHNHAQNHKQPRAKPYTTMRKTIHNHAQNYTQPRAKPYTTIRKSINYTQNAATFNNNNKNTCQFQGQAYVAVTTMSTNTRFLLP